MAVTKSHGLFPAASSSKKRYSARWLRWGFAVQVVRAEGGGGGAEESPHGGVERERLRVAPGEVISERLLERPQWAARFPLAYRNSAEQQSRHQRVGQSWGTQMNGSFFWKQVVSSSSKNPSS